jgi:hypothetical protein
MHPYNRSFARQRSFYREDVGGSIFSTRIPLSNRIHTMKAATNYEDQGDLKNPINQVVAIVPHEADLQGIVADLHEAGFTSEGIGVLSGRRGAHKLDAASGRHGWLAKLAQIGPGFGDLDASNMRAYAEALRHNETVIAVVATLGSKRREIANLLKQYGAKLINSYGMFSIEGLG